MPGFRYTDPTTGKTWISPKRLSDEELNEAFGDQTRPLSQIKAPGVQDLTSHPYPATAARIGLPILGAIGGGPLGGGLGAAAGVLAGNVLEGTKPSLGELGGQAALGTIGASGALEGATIAESAEATRTADSLARMTDADVTPSSRC